MRDQFEQAILQTPEDASNFAVYADWLIEQDDPRGEFIHIQLQLEDRNRSAEERQALRRQESEFLEHHSVEWLGSLAELFFPETTGPGKPKRCDGFDFRFHRGWLGTVRVGVLYERVARRIIEAPEARLLQTLLVMHNGDLAAETLLLIEDFPPLHELDLADTGLTNNGASDLLRWPGLRELDEPDVSDNFLSEERCKSLETACERANVSGQVKPPDDGDDPDMYDATPE